MAASDWRINADERTRYESFFQQCGPTQGYLSGEQARDFFVKSNLPGDILRKIWDLADISADGRLDTREFIIACHLIASQVQKKGPLPTILPPSLLSDSGATTNGIPSVTTSSLLTNTASTQPVITGQSTGPNLTTTDSNNLSIVPITPTIRSKYLQQFHSIVDVTKTNGLMNGLQAKTILQQTGLSYILLHQIWDLADYDKDGCLTPDEFIVAMHCCDIARTGQSLPIRFPDEWLHKNIIQQERIDTSSKSNDNRTFASLNQQLKEISTSTNTTENTSTNRSNETTEAERKLIMQTYEEKRLRNYEDGNRELERRRQLLREQEEREQKEREERERKRELELQKQKEEQERKKQMEIERQLEKQRQIEQQKEEERKKLYEQREAARKEMERKSHLEWERQRMQELSTQKSRLHEQINDLKSREKAFEFELESIDDTIQTCQTKINQIETNIHTIDESIADIQRNIMTEKNLFDNAEQQIKDLKVQLNTVQEERESLDSSLNQLNQSIEFSMSNRESDQFKNLQTQTETMKQESTQIDEQIVTITDQCKEYQNQMEQLRLELDQLEQEAKAKMPLDTVTSPENPPAEFANFDQFNASVSTNDLNNQSSDVSTNDLNNQPSDVSSSLAAIPTTTSPTPAVEVDPFQTVDPFASHADISSTTENNDWFQPSRDNPSSPIVDPFLPKTEPTESLPSVASPRIKKAAPKANPYNKIAPKIPSNVDPWGGPTTTKNNGNDWAQFNNNNNTSSPFGTTTEWPQTTTVSNENSSTDAVQYRALYDYTPERPDEIAISSGDIIIVDPSKQQDEHWLFGQIGNDKQGFFPAVYAERMTPTPSINVVDTTSQLSSGSWVMTLAECQGKTVDKHLSFQKGELILVREQKDATWYSGQLHDKIGWFPRNYVRPATEIEIENNKNLTKDTSINEKSLNSSNSNDKISNDVNNADIYEAIYSYEATDSTDLSFDVGERIIVLKCDGDWWTGQIGDRTGLFPNNYVQKINNIQETAIAITPFQSTEEDHLSFEQDQIIYIIKKDDKGWYQGEIRLPDQPVRVGWFPGNCVQIQEAVSSTVSHQNISKLPQYIAIFPYEAQQDDEISFPADAILEILHEANTSGWFKARFGDQVGLIPSTYVQPIDAHNQSSSIPCQLSSNIIPCTPTTANSLSQHPFSDDSTMTLTADSSTLITDISSHQTLNNTSRISAIRELIETEQRYVNDLRIVANDFIKPLSNGRILNDYEIEQLFSNWFSLIACNTVFLSTLQEQVQYKEHVITSDIDISMRTLPRSASMSHMTTVAQVPINYIVDKRSRSFIPQMCDSPPIHQSQYHTKTERIHRSPSANNLTVICPISIKRSDDNIVPQSSHLSSTMTINESTRIGEILCSYLPYMADTYFQYCNCRSQADKYLQSKIDLNEQFRSYLQIFQNKTGGLSLNGFLTKPIQRVTRYPLLIEKILKYTIINHPDYQYIQQAYECARQLNERINKQICIQENCLRLDWLQQHIILSTDENSTDGYLFDELLKFNSITKLHKQRQLLLHGFLMKVSSGKDLLVFLFNDFLLFSTIKTSSNNWQSQLFEPKSNLQLKLYRLPLLLTDIIVANEILHDQLSFYIRTKIYEKPLVLKTQQTNIRTLWVRAINNALEESQIAEKLILADKTLFSTTDQKDNSKSAIAHLMLVVLEARDLIPSITTLERHRTLNPYCEITVDSLTLKTTFMKRTNNPKWNASMQFFLYDMAEDIIHINIFDNEFFSPNENIGHASIHVKDILPCSLDSFLTQPSQSFTQTIYLNTGASVVMNCTIQYLL
ncbi:unnamed protein product [Rotaria sordida]|uniref:Intersectin-1 n=1 Tax=Rotaria sordida TaxID=392033 RepID=A0A813TXC8_9BILA|nr:unnamed protein product [Rotaria sordida]